MEVSPIIPANVREMAGKNETSSIFKSLRESLGARVLAVATALGAMGATTGCKKDMQERDYPAAITPVPVFDSGKLADGAVTGAITKPDPETIRQQELIQTDGFLEGAIENYTEVFMTPVAGKDSPVPIFYMDPYKAFKIVSKAQMPAVLRKDKAGKQAFHDEQRKLIAADPKNNLVRVRLHDENPERELPIVASITPETSLAMVIKSARNPVVMPFSRKQVPLIDVLGGEIDKVFPTTGIYKDLRATRSTMVEEELASKKKEAITLEKKAMELKRQGSNAAMEELKTVKSDLNTLYKEIINLDKERRKPTLYADEMRELLLYGLPAQEAVYGNKKSAKNARGPWQITDAACEQILGKKACATANLGDPALSTNVALKYFDYMYGILKEDIQALEKAYDIGDPNELLIPCLITSYNAGYNRVQKMIRWFIKNADPAVKEKVDRGEIIGEDLFMYMSISFYHASAYDREKQGVDGLYGHDALTYYPKIAAWARLIPDYVHTEAGDKLVAEAEEAEKNGDTLAPQASASAAVPSASSPRASASAPLPFVSAQKDKAPAVKETTVKGKNRPCGLTVRIPEEQLRSPNYPRIEKSPVGDITITGGFMEDHGHSNKPPQKAIFEDGVLRQLPASDRNLGIDYKEEKWKILTWFGGTVERIGLEGGYGNRIVIKTDATYRFNGKDYTVYQAYGHAASFMDNIKKGQKISQFQHIGTMGGTGKNGPRSYSPHIDCRTYIIVNGETIDLSLNALENQLKG